MFVGSFIIHHPFLILTFSPDLDILTWNVQAFCTHSKLWRFCLFPSCLRAFFLRSFSTWTPPLFLHILQILWEIKATSSSFESSSDLSSDESSTFSTLDELLKTCSPDNDAFYFFLLLRAIYFSLLRHLSCWSSCSWTLRVPTSSSRDI